MQGPAPVHGAPRPLSDAVLILASSSPRRCQLLRDAGYDFVVVEPPLDEPPLVVKGLDSCHQAEALAYFKARTVFDRRPDAWVIGADTICDAGGEVMGKPSDQADARRMLRRLSAQPHRVITGAAILLPGGARLIASDVTWITMRPMTDKELDDYIDSGEWIGKAGAYAIQESADRFVTRVEGSFTNVVGLPMELLERMMHELAHHAQRHMF